MRDGCGIPFDPQAEAVRGRGVGVGVKIESLLWEVVIGGVLAAVEEAGFILAENARWLGEKKEKKRPQRIGRQSSTMVVFVGRVAETNILLGKRLWIGGR